MLLRAVEFAVVGNVMEDIGVLPLGDIEPLDDGEASINYKVRNYTKTGFASD